MKKNKEILKMQNLFKKTSRKKIKESKKDRKPKEKKLPKTKIDLKEIIEVKKTEQSEKQDNREETFEEESFIAPPEEKHRIKTNTILEETLDYRETTPDATLEESLTGIETKKTSEDRKDFYSSVNYGTKSDNLTQKYHSPIRSIEATQRNQERGPMTIADIHQNPVMTNITNPDIQTELKKYSSRDNEKYSIQNLEEITPEQISNRRNNQNPFLQDLDPIKYEQG